MKSEHPPSRHVETKPSVLCSSWESNRYLDEQRDVSHLIRWLLVLNLQHSLASASDTQVQHVWTVLTFLHVLYVFPLNTRVTSCLWLSARSSLVPMKVRPLTHLSDAADLSAVTSPDRTITESGNSFRSSETSELQHHGELRPFTHHQLLLLCFFFIFIHRCFLFYRHMLVSLLCSGLQLMGGGVCWRQQTDAAVSRKVEDQLEPVPVPLSPETSAQRRGRKHTRETLFKVSRVSLMSAQTLNTDHKSFICLLFLRAATLILFLFSVISVAVSLMWFLNVWLVLIRWFCSADHMLNQEVVRSCTAWQAKLRAK